MKSEPKFWKIDNWYEFDIRVYNFYDHCTSSQFHREKIKDALKTIGLLIDELRKKGLCDSWFFLFEGSYIRIRIKSSNRSNLDSIVNFYFSTDVYLERKVRCYREERWKFDCEESVELFAETFRPISEMCIKKSNGEINFDPYRMYERLCHCIHVNLYGQQNESVILVKRLSERLSQQDQSSIYEKF